MEEKRKPGRPKVDAGFIEKEKNTHRAAVNYKYAMDGADLIDRYTDIIPDGKLLWYMDVENQEAYGRNGVLEQIGRMMSQDNLSDEDCIAITNYAASAIKAGSTTREVEKAIREIRKRIKELSQDENDPVKMYAVGCAINELNDMGK